MVVDDLAFASNCSFLLAEFMEKLSKSFYVKCFGELKTFIGWEIDQRPNRFRISQHRYVGELLSKYGMEHCNATFTPMSTEGYIRPASEAEAILV